MSSPSTVVIADDDPRSRAQTRRALDGHGFTVVGEAADASGAVGLATELRPDVCLFDVHMPGGGVRATAEVAIALPDTAVVLYTVSSADADVFGALRAGARGYLLKDTDPARLPLALKGVLTGEAAIPRSLARRLMEEFRGRERPTRLMLPDGRPVRLTSREWDVLELLRQGLTTAEISERLYVSAVTVRTHISSIVHKLHVANRAEALALVEGGRHDPGAIAGRR